MKTKLKAWALSFLVMMSAPLFAQEAANRVAVGFNLSQYQKDFGAGLHFISPYFANGKAAVKAGVNLQWFENSDGTKTTWSTYQNIQLGMRSRMTVLENKIFIYGEGGLLTILPSDVFSTKSVVVGGFALFGFELKSAQNFSYFIEMGSIGTGARADKIGGEPIYSNGFVTNVGFRIML